MIPNLLMLDEINIDEDIIEVKLDDLIFKEEFTD